MSRSPGTQQIEDIRLEMGMSKSAAYNDLFRHARELEANVHDLSTEIALLRVERESLINNLTAAVESYNKRTTPRHWWKHRNE